MPGYKERRVNYSPTYPPYLTHRELAELHGELDRQGCVLLWSDVLADLVVCCKHRGKDVTGQFPAGIVVYTLDELRYLFGAGMSIPSVRRKHRANKGRFEGHDVNGTCGG